VRFSLPEAAHLIDCSHAYGVDSEADKKIIKIEIKETSEIIFHFCLNVSSEGHLLRLVGRSLVFDVSKYELNLTFGNKIRRDELQLSPFLRDAEIPADNMSLRLIIKAAEPRLYVVDFGMHFTFKDSALALDRIKAILEDMRVLKSLGNKADAIFTGYRTIMLLHFVQDLLPFVYSLELRGLDPSKALMLYKNYPYGQISTVRETLRNRGYQLFGPVKDARDFEFINALEDFVRKSEEPIIVIEDGGYVLPAFHLEERLRSYQKYLHGFVEQTTYGAREAEKVLAVLAKATDKPRLASPLINVAQSEAKTLYEPWFVAEAACNNVWGILGGPRSWTGIRVLVIGYGAIGRSVMEFLKRNNANVAVCDPSPLRLVLASHRGADFVAPSVSEACAMYEDRKHTLHYVFGATGLTSVTADDAKKLARWNPTLVSLSSKQIEFDLAGFSAIAEAQKWQVSNREIGCTYSFGDHGKINILGDGYPINFVAAESIENRLIDPIMAILHASSAELARPTVLLDRSLEYISDRDEDYPALPWNRISNRIVENIIDTNRLFSPMLERI
jgi:S-adenosylhomocysteine hydrolase